MKRFWSVLPLLIAIAPAAAAQEPADTVFELTEVETAPVPSNVEELRAVLESTYPPEKRAAGQGATVAVAFVLGTDGVPRGVAVTESTDAAFDSATVAAVRLLRFSPAQVAGRPVAVRLEIPVQWEPGAREAAWAATAEADSIAAAGRPRVYHLEDVDPQPRPTNQHALRRELNRLYPTDLRAAGVEATVQVRFVVTERGEVDLARVTHSTDARFNAPTLVGIRALRFRPGRVDGRAVPTWVELPILWTP